MAQAHKHHPARRGPRFVVRRWLWLTGALAVVVIVVLIALAHGASGPPPPLPQAGVSSPSAPGDPFAYVRADQPNFTARAAAGSAHVLFVKSPGGVLATATRVAAFRPLVDAATAGSGIDPNILEGIAFVESAGRPEVIAGSDPANAAGLTQILAGTGQSLLRMHIDLARSRRLTAAIAGAAASGNSGAVVSLDRRRASIDDRFDPRKALAATVRYLVAARQRLGRSDLAVVSYHMGIGNLENVISDYDGGRPVPYAQLYFDTALDRHPAAYGLLSGFGDDSWLYYWKVLEAAQIMHLYRTDRGALRRLAAQQTAMGSAAEVLHPPDVARPYPDPTSLDRAYGNHAIVPLPANGPALGLAYDPQMGVLAHRTGAPVALYRGLRPAALELLIELAARVRTLSKGAAPLTVVATVEDQRYQRLLGVSDPPAASGYTFTLARRYVSHAQAEALQSMLDRLQALNLIAWQRFPSTIEVTVASDAPQAIAHGI